MKKIYLTEYIHPAARAYLAERAEIIDDETRLDEIDGVITRNGIVIDRAFMDAAPHLRAVGVHGTGMDVVDLPEAARRGINVFNTPGLNSLSVAELNVMLAMNLLRKVPQAERMLYGKGESGLGSDNMGFELSGKLCGMIGVGTITRKTAAILKNGFGCEVIGWSRSFTPEKAVQLGIWYRAAMADVLREADIVFLGLALNRDTEGIIGADELALMKRNAYLINAARGALVDEKALYLALKKNMIKAAACDVFTREPVGTDEPLLSLDNFMATPHLGANTEEALYRVGMAVVKGVLERV